jgi:hypothetical protein
MFMAGIKSGIMSETSCQAESGFSRVAHVLDIAAANALEIEFFVVGATPMIIEGETSWKAADVRKSPHMVKHSM